MFSFSDCSPQMCFVYTLQCFHKIIVCSSLFKNRDFARHGGAHHEFQHSKAETARSLNSRPFDLVDLARLARRDRVSKNKKKKEKKQNKTKSFSTR